MASGIRLSQAEAEERFRLAGFELLSEYSASSRKVMARCHKHQEVHEVYPGNIFRGQKLWCCANEGRRIAHTGKSVSEETRRKLSRYRGRNHHGHGVARSKATRARVSASLRATAARSVEYAILKAATGKTAAKPGIFYVALAGNGLLKLGSISRMTIARRMEVLSRDTGHSQLLMMVSVPDAGAYEAMMLDRCRNHWSHGEYFHNWLAARESTT